MSMQRSSFRGGSRLSRSVLAASMALGTVTGLATLATPPEALAQQREEQVKPGFNIFSREQEIEIGRQSAAQVERQLPMLRDGRTQEYVENILERLARHAPGHQYPYQIRVVNTADVNAFALPAGFMYAHRGLIQAARTEGELAGVLAHEMAHVALRHGTHQASKAYVTQAGVGVLGGLLGLGRGRDTTSQIVNVIGGLGMNALFLKFGRDDEYQADLVGARIMHAAGYDPRDMASFFDLLQTMRNGNPGAVEQFFSSHPSPANRAQRIRAEAQRLGGTQVRMVGGLQDIQAELRSMGPAPTMAQVQRGQVPSGSGRTSRGRVTPGRVPAPSGRFRRHEQRDGFFAVQYPDNWRVYEAQQGMGVTIAPEGGIVEGPNGEAIVVYGVMINHYDPFQNRSRGRITLNQALDDLIAQVRQSNPHLRRTGGIRRGNIDGAPSVQAVMSGNSQVTGMEERVTVFLRELSDGHVMYALFVAPGRDYGVLSPSFEQMIGSLQVNDSVAHR